MIERSHQRLFDHVENIALPEAIFVPGGGFRSVLGTFKHAAGRSHVYRSFAFDQEPQHWGETDWPRGLRETVDKSEAYLEEVKDWFQRARVAWLRHLERLRPEQLEELRPMQ